MPLNLRAISNFSEITLLVRNHMSGKTNATYFLLQVSLSATIMQIKIYNTQTSIQLLHNSPNKQEQSSATKFEDIFITCPAGLQFGN